MRQFTFDGELVHIKRARHACPIDGVHRPSSSGAIRGPSLAYRGDQPIPHGNDGFYWRRDNDTGIKVYFSLKRKDSFSLEIVERIFERGAMFADRGICIRPIDIVGIDVRIVYKGVGYEAISYGIEMEHVHVVEEAWENFLRGYPYDWTCLATKEHPAHCVNGFKELAKVAQMAGVEKLNLGDIAYCTKKRRWYLVDVEVRK